MMQQVATTKSDVAAIATNTGSELQLDSSSNQDFGRMLQDQKSKDTGASPLVGKSAFENAKKSDGKVIRAPAVNKVTDEKIEKPSVEKGTNEVVSKSSDVDDSSEKQSDQIFTLGSQTGTDEKSPVYIDDIIENPPVYIDGITEVVTELDKAGEWVSLVENLQKLTNQSEPQNKDLLSDDSAEVVPEGDVATIKTDELSDIKMPDVTTAADKDVIDLMETQSKVSVENTSNDNEASIQDEELIITPIDKLLQKIFDRVLETPDSETQSSSSIDNLASKKESAVIDELLSQPELLQQAYIEGASDIQPAEQDPVSQVDLSAEESIALLNDLLIPVNLDKTEQVGSEEITLIDSVEQQAAEVASLFEESATVEELVSSEAKIKVNSSDSEITGAKSALKVPDELAGEPTLQDIIVSQDVSEQIETVNPDITVKASPIALLANLPETKQNKALTNIAQQLLGKEVVTDNTVNQTIENSLNKELADVVSTVSSPVKEFIGALKSGLSEFKTQLSQGREPGIDLKSLVTESLNKIVESNPTAQVVEGSEQVINGISQILDIATSVNRGVEQHTAANVQTYNSTLREASQIQGEQTKQVQLSQESKFEKAVNIAKPEGLQQLAEKVRWMANSKNLVAEIRLDPADLGSVHVKVAMSGESATVNFVVQSQQTRDAMDSATPRLREMLAEKGIELGQSSVRQDSDNQQQDGSGQLADNANSAQENADDNESVIQQGVEQKIVNGALGGIDYFV